MPHIEGKRIKLSFGQIEFWETDTLVASLDQDWATHVRVPAAEFLPDSPLCLKWSDRSQTHCCCLAGHEGDCHGDNEFEDSFSRPVVVLCQECAELLRKNGLEVYREAPAPDLKSARSGFLGRLGFYRPSPLHLVCWAGCWSLVGFFAWWLMNR